MSDLTYSSAAGVPKAGAVDLDSVFRGALFVMMFLLVWVSLHPFQSLSEAPSLTSDGGDRANQIVFGLAFVVLFAWAFRQGIERLKPLLRPAMVLTLAWFGLSVLTSWDPSLSARRLVFSLMVMGLAAVTLMLPKNIRHFSDLLAAAALIVLALCYAGLILAPSVSIHHASDFLEPEHAGSWRGLFPHKNQAGAMMVVFFIIGLFVARMRSVALGAIISCLALIFLVFTHSKTPIALLPLTLIMSAVVTRSRRPAIAMTVAIGTSLLFNLFSVGSVYFDSVHAILARTMEDPSFTGRSDIWKFALQELGQRPFTGYGFSAFWGTERVMFGAFEGTTWATAATDAHNAYLNIAVTTGVPGLLLMGVWLMVLPLCDFYRHADDPQSRLLAVLFLRIWLFGIYTASFESVLFQPSGDLWFIFIIAVFGLRYLTRARIAA